MRVKGWHEGPQATWKIEDIVDAVKGGGRMKTVAYTHCRLACELPGYMGPNGECRRFDRFMHHYGNAWPIYVIDNGSSPEACAKVRAQYPEITLYNAPHLEYGREPHAYPHVWRFYDHLKTLFAEYEKVIVLATDAYILSQRLVDYIEGIDFGWTALWCHNHPATEISVIVRGCKAFDDFAVDPYKLMGNMEEFVVPLTRIEKYFTGNRYGELTWRPGDSAQPSLKWTTSRRCLMVTLGQMASYGVMIFFPCCAASMARSWCNEGILSSPAHRWWGLRDTTAWKRPLAALAGNAGMRVFVTRCV